ncbi:hypothetical protein TNIN_417301 [Trichonephila inaurata madagascariensis]|uniref:Uncharacterized protein n=1 Tax=Trichonephila inaurata madagascariensis TaxID=2747483 RepID=A0A8X7C013_9ARAC|nr:hypothetical protein TNIN_417301 [Trichonephila inaurata madagascariensis]
MFSRDKNLKPNSKLAIVNKGVSCLQKAKLICNLYSPPTILQMRRILAALPPSSDNSNDGKDLFVVVFFHRLLFLGRYCVSCKENEAVRIPSPTLSDVRAIGRENILPIEKREKEILSV